MREPSPESAAAAATATAGTTLGQQQGGRPIHTHTAPYYQDFACGLLTGLTEISITFPVQKLIFRQQLHGILLNQAWIQLRTEGIRHLYRGLIPPLLQKTSSRAVMFGMYEENQRILGCGEPFGPCHVTAAFLAGSTEAVLCPFERIQTLLQSSEFHGRFRNTWHAFTSLRVFGLREYYRGLSIILLRNGPSNIVWFAGREPLMRVFETPKLKPVGDAISGAILGATLSTLFFPLSVVKARSMSRLGGEFEPVWTILGRIWRERNGKLRELFRGANLNATRSFFSWGITNAAFEFFERVLFGRSW